MKFKKPTTIIALFTLAMPGILMADRFTREESREFSADSLQKVDVQANAANIAVIGSDQSSVTIDIELTVNAKDQESADAIFDAAKLTFNEEDGVLEVELKNKGKKTSYLGVFKGNKAAHAEITVKVPLEMDLFVKAGAGNVSVADVTGDIQFTTGSGNVNGSNVAGDVKATTGSGNLHLEAAEGSVKARTGSGSIHVASMEGSLNAATGSGSLIAEGKIHAFSAKTGSGSIRVDSSVVLTGDSKAATGSGGVVVVLPEESGFGLSAGVGSGGIDCAFDLVDPVAKKRSLKGATATEGPQLSVATGSGSINISKR